MPEAYSYIWVFEVRRDCLDAFRRSYGEGGDWVRLFRRAPGYLGTALLEDVNDPLRFITIDTWQSVEAYEAFKETHAAEYAELDRRCEGLTTKETPLGHYLRRIAGPEL
jgi:heme-degrading monooxygenase HmoA